MNNQTVAAGPLEQVLTQVQHESGNEDLSGLTPADVSALAESLWTWASGIAAGQQAVRVIADATGPSGALGRSLLEATGPDMPFLVDSLLGECAEQGHEVRTLFHPVVRLHEGRMVSVIQIHLPRLTAEEARRLEAGALRTLSDTALVVADFKPMKDRMRAEIRRLSVLDKPTLSDALEAVAFLEWLTKNHFVFLGCREYRFETDSEGGVLPEEPIMIEGSNLGLLRDEDVNVLSRDAEPLVLTPEIGALLSEPFPLIVAKSTLVSRVHRRVPCDYIGVKTYDEAGRVNGEVRFLGLFTAEAYDETARSIPFIRRRVMKVIASSGATAGGHTEKAIANLLETWPRDELFQTPSKVLAPMIMGALHLIGRPRTRLFVRRDQFDRFVSAIVYVPREAYDTSLRERITEALTEAYAGSLIRFQPYFDSGPMARVHFQIALDRGHPTPDPVELEARIAQLSRTWDQGFREALMAADLGHEHREGARAFLGAFNAAYREAFPPEEAMRDVEAMARLSAARPILARAFRGAGDDADKVRVKIYAREGSIPLSACVPVFERMGLFVAFETGYPVRPGERPVEDAPDVYWVHDLSMRTADRSPIDLDTLADEFETAFESVWCGLAENDGFNRLVVAAGTTWREAALMRTLCAYRRQTGMDQPQDVQEAALARYPSITRQLIDLFAARFDPATAMSLEGREAACRKLRGEIEESLRDVRALADDQVLRRLADLILCIQRTNFYQRENGQPLAFISVKIASRELADLPEPKPFREIFMSSPKVEGVHLRFGPVARGGLRWSDRAADYRTEVLGLVKAQQVKNAVIVPVGSKGGFYPKQLPDRSDRNAWFEGGRDAYKEFITSLLGLTDNLVDGALVAPKDTIIWDGEDPYLVVAADKGTATFSDTANAISLARGHWLGDAFASGGSAGYDHKKMGITARGGWEAVKRHFREMGTDIQTQPFTVIGVGDMSGDVFGNGMLLSPEIRLVAAFNHMHVFVDPNPGDSAKNLAERQRLFDLPQSTWADYDASLISAGGGIFDRSAKSINLSAEIKALTGLSKDSVTPDELIHALLKTQTDLLWFGGIGTYVKASAESHADAGDRANDTIRVSARELRAKVVGEGANLGLTQAARIEFALTGGRINTDAIDNSAGVDSSDHEVNIKILAAEAIRLGALKAGDRDALLADMTDDVAAHVLRHNYDQTAALTLAEVMAENDHEALERLMVSLEERGVLNRALEGLPDTGEMKVRAEQAHWLTRPELAVLLAWSKITLFDDLVASDLPDDPYFHSVLKGYFPSPIDGFGEAMDNHRLKREIIATVVANRTLDMAGPIALLRLREVTGADNARVVRGMEAARAALDFDDFRHQVDALDNQIDAEVQTELRLQAAAALHEAAVWFIQSRPHGTMEELVQQTHDPLSRFMAALPSIHSPFAAARIERAARALAKRGAPEELARWAPAMSHFAQGLVVIDVAARTGADVADAGACFFQIGDALKLDRMRASAREGLAKAGFWDRVAGRRLVSELVHLQAVACEDAIAKGGAEAWLAAHADGRKDLLATLSALSKEKSWSFAKFALSADAVRQFMAR
ncbi:MAG: NAD-glutamate dehydrogenase [Hyphomonas sp.]|uniref:NAD-glutamate dehydrogenase n=1 Tax=Hyphomonas sp. TaxID=87 RepID=UPI0035271270